MNLHVLSDLHVEFEEFSPSVPPETDVVILAGDIYTKARAARWAKENLPPATPVILIAGNHDSYQTSLQSAHRHLRADAEGGVHFLENEAFEHQGVRFLGCTCWTDFNSTGAQAIAMLKAQATMNDYRFIRYEPRYRRLLPNDTRAIAEASKAWLLAEVRKPYMGKTVVVTHMPPLMQFFPADHRPGDLDAAYANHWPEFLDCKIDLWVFGHTHHSVDEVIGDIRFVSNARGYPQELTGFRPDLLITI